MRHTLRKALALLLCLMMVTALAGAAYAAAPDDWDGMWEEKPGEFYFYKNGKLQTGWIEETGSWTDEDGVQHTWTNTYYAGKDGKLLSGWQTINGKLYYFDESTWTDNEGNENKNPPIMTVGDAENGYYIYQIGDDFYYFHEDGSLKYGWIEDTHSWTDEDTGKTYSYTDWYYAGSDGKFLKGWQVIDGKQYYFVDGTYTDEYGTNPEWPSMYSDGAYTIDGAAYFFDKNGVMQTGWIEDQRSYTDEDSGVTNTWTDWYYAYDNGSLARGWTEIGGTWYFFENGSYTEEDGTVELYPPTMYYDGPYEIDGLYYYFHEDGSYARDGYETVDYTINYGGGVTDKRSTTFYAYPDGHLYVGWDTLNGSWVYFGPTLCKGPRQIDDAVYCFDSNGALYNNGYFTYSDYWLDASSVRHDYSIRGYAMSNGVLWDGGWDQDAEGRWSYYGPIAISGLFVPNDSSVAYLFDKDGYLMENQPGWQPVDRGDGVNQWYYLNSDGTCLTGWFNDGGAWYYLNYSMYADGAFNIDGVEYNFAANGALIGEPPAGTVSAQPSVTPAAVSGTWMQDGTGWWYQYSDGSYPYSTTVTIDGVDYSFDANGYWIEDGGAESSGTWIQDATGWWYQYADGSYPYSTTVTIDGVDYSFDASGYWVA